MSEPKLSEDLQGELGLRLAAGQYAAWREATQRSEALEARLSKMEEALDIERLAAIEHSQWMAWARTLMDEEPVLSASRQDRWQAMMVDYSELPEETKEYDREWARIVIGEALAGEEA